TLWTDGSAWPAARAPARAAFCRSVDDRPEACVGLRLTRPGLRVDLDVRGGRAPAAGHRLLARLLRPGRPGLRDPPQAVDGNLASRVAADLAKLTIDSSVRRRPGRQPCRLLLRSDGGPGGGRWRAPGRLHPQPSPGHRLRDVRGASDPSRSRR